MILIPAAGEGSRFKAAGYKEPKHLLPLGGKTMIQWVLQNVSPLAPGEPWAVVTQESVGQTRGAVDTILQGHARYRSYSEGQLVIANCDQLLLLPEDPQMQGDGIIFTFRSANPAHSYVLTDNWLEKIYDIVEKPEVPPSDRAVSGVYWFREAGPFLTACKKVYHNAVALEPKELYVSSALKVMIEDGYDLYAQDAPTAILGTPEDFQRFEVALACAKS